MRVRRRISIDNASQSFVFAVTMVAGTFEFLMTIKQISRGEPAAIWAATGTISFLLFIIARYASFTKKTNALQLQLMSILDAYEGRIRKLGEELAKMVVRKDKSDDSV